MVVCCVADSPTPKSASCRYPPPVVVYTDAQGLGHCAAVVFPPGKARPLVAHKHAPQWIIDLPEDECGIFEYELLGVALGISLLLERFTSLAAVLCCDNMGAVGTVIRGSCTTRMGRLLSGYIWKLVSGHSTHLWVEFANSNNNAGDAPSRCCGVEVRENEFTRMGERCVLPKRFAHAFSSMDALGACLNTGPCPSQPTILFGWECPHVVVDS